MIKENLKKLRIENKKTQEEIGKLLNLTQQSYAKYEQGITEPDIDKLKILSNYYNISIDELVKDNVTIISQGGNMENRPLTSEEENALNNALSKTNQIEKLSNEEISELRKIIEWFNQIKK